jgi:dTDP-glucose pyrophosphorylase
MQLIIPAAGLGSRFIGSKYSLPKPLIKIHGVPMLALALNNLCTESVSTITVLTREEIAAYPEFDEMRDFLPAKTEFKFIDYVTNGPADSVEIAAEGLIVDEPVCVANVDQFVDFDLQLLYNDVESGEFDGAILTMRDDSPKWSYVRLDELGLVTEVKEKEVISNDATVGIYVFRSLEQMLSGFKAMRLAGDTTNSEYYVAPSYNYLIGKGERIANRSIGPVSDFMFGLGLPEDLDNFLNNDKSIDLVNIAMANSKNFG